MLPPIRRPHEVVGRVTPEASEETGLAAGTPVVAGSADHVASAFAAGIIDEGGLLVKLGGAGDILRATDRPLVDERLYLDLHLVPPARRRTPLTGHLPPSMFLGRTGGKPWIGSSPPEG